MYIAPRKLKQTLVVEFVTGHRAGMSEWFHVDRWNMKVIQCWNVE